MYKKVSLGILILLVFFGGFTARSCSEKLLNSNDRRSDRINVVNELIQKYYVDTVDMDSLQQKVIPLMLSQLDPHSAYLPAELNKREEESLEGSFQGIGVQFNRLIDTVVVTRVVKGGAAERAELRAGDRILKADSISLEGAELTNDFIMKKLKGPAKSVVDLTIRRDNEIIHKLVVRGPVPISSIDAHYTLSDSILYVRLNRWGARTHQEFLNAYIQSKQKHEIKGFIIDLRDNSGGYMQAALSLSAEFLEEGKELLYIKGKSYPKEEFKSEKDGLFTQIPLTVLINEYSASASEIFAGLMQDHDRALIIGRRSFGKGLVQSPFMLSDSSVVRLTIARYYIPSNRCIQRDYSKGYGNYAMDISKRYEHGELFNSDSIAQADSTTLYHTLGGRPVYGGGGITPDLFIPRDSTGFNSYYLRLLQSGTLPHFAFNYADTHRKTLGRFKTVESLYNYLVAQRKSLLFEYAYYAQSKGIPIRTSLLHRSSEVLLSQLRALIADNVSADMGAFYEIINKRNQAVLTAEKAIKDGSWKPKLPKHKVEQQHKVDSLSELKKSA